MTNVEKRITTYTIPVYTATTFAFMTLAAVFMLWGGITILTKAIECKEFRILNFSISAICFLAIYFLFFCHTARITVTKDYLTYRVGFYKKEFPIVELASAEIVNQNIEKIISYKLFAFAAPGQWNGLFRSTDGRKLYIVGSGEHFFKFSTATADAYIALSERNPNFTRFAESFVVSFNQKIEAGDVSASFHQTAKEKL